MLRQLLKVFLKLFYWINAMLWSRAFVGLTLGSQSFINVLGAITPTGQYEFTEDNNIALAEDDSNIELEGYSE